jgi:electron transfer flavoprotein alpha subunit
MTMSILVYVDQVSGVAKQTSWEILGKGRALADQLGKSLAALVVGEGAGQVAQEAIAYGADKVWVAEGPDFAQYRTLAYAAALKMAIDQAQPEIVLLSNGINVRDMAAMVACELDAGLAADCQDLQVDDAGNLQTTRPIYSGNILTTVTFTGKPQIATVRSRSFPMPQPQAGRTGETVALSLPAGSSAAREQVVNFEPAQQADVSLENAGVVVSGGRGVKGPEGFEPIRALAKTLGGAVGASRAAVDAGWIPYNTQVGQTGKTVRPDLYIACGISGAIQHLAGMSNAKVIVAINKDKDAPIFTVARYGILGDLFEVVPALNDALKQRLGK